MANTKNAKATKVENKEENKELEKEVVVNPSESEEIIALKKQLEEMQKAMMAMMTNNMVAQNSMANNSEENEVVIGCRVLQGIGWGNPKDTGGEIRLRFNEEQAVTVSDMKKFFRNYSVKKLFIDGICYFKDKEDYAKFGIKNFVDLSNENLLDVLTNGDTNTIVGEIAEITENKKNSNIVNCIIYRICDMIRRNQLTWDYYTRKGVEQYLGIEFDRGIMTLTAIDNLRG